MARLPSASLARPGAPPNGPEWYPVGRLVLWAAGINAFIVGAALLSFGTDLASLQSAVRDSGLEEAVGQQLENPDDAGQLIDMMVRFLPGVAAASMTLTTVFNLWLAGRVVKISGRLSGNLNTTLPTCSCRCLLPPFSAQQVAGSFLPDLFGISSSALAACLMVAHVLLGLAVIHASTLGLSGRGFILGSVYASVLIFSWPFRWPLLLIGLIGITDAMFDLRGLIARRRADRRRRRSDFFHPIRKYPPDA